MTTRNRTEDYLRLRGFKKGIKRADGESLLGGMTSVQVTPIWVKKMDELRRIQTHIAKRQDDLEELHTNHLKVQFGALRDEENEEMIIEKITSEINGLFQTAERGIHELEAVYMSEIEDDYQGGSEATDAELTILRNVKMCLANEIARLGYLFKEKRRRYARNIQNQKRIVAKGVDEEQKAVREALQRDAIEDHCRQRGMTQDQIEEILLNRQDIEDRLEGIQRIAQSTESLNEMFRDLNQLVIEQGTILDRIDENMQITHQRVVKGRRELEKAAASQKGGCFKVLVLLMIVLIIVFVIALIIKVL
eukprot:Tbor_TRINITY_DN4301_c0_g1::TRINITY_DN4301_c0_g1_i1::g.7735::m.7735/K08489/STX16; syntaxin 16